MLLATAGMAAKAEVQKLLTATRIEDWLQQDLFQLKWWFLLGLTVFVFLLWWRLLAKQRLPEIMLYAVLMMILMMGVDEYGDELVLWDYPVDILPIFPVITATNLLILPLAYSLVYQHFTTWKSFLRIAVMVAALVSFVVEPGMAAGGFYQLLNWKYHYSLPVYIAAALLIRWMVGKVFAIAKQA